jgi:acetyl esterase/lipase
VLIGIHGGNWSHGYKEWLGFGAGPIVEAGAIFVSIEYRLSGVAKWPAQLDDCLAALAWIYKNIAQYGGDPNRIFISGHSAGGHLAAMVTLSKQRFQDFELPQDVIKACFPYSGVYDLRHGGLYTADAKTGPGDSLIDSQNDAEAASPVCCISGNTTPFFVTWGERDNPVMMAQGPPFVLALKTAPGRAEGRVFAGFDHFHVHLDQLNPRNYLNRVVLAWMFGDPETTPLPLL